MSVRRAISSVFAMSAALAALGWPRDGASHNPVLTTVTFDREIVALIERRCVQCHIEGGMAMALGTYAEARPWAVAIKEEALARRMPPWPAERGYGEFVNDGGLTQREFDFLISWVDGGVPKGQREPRPLQDHRNHWMLGEPHRRETAKDGAKVEAGSPVAFQRIVIDPDLTKSTWIRAIDYKPGDHRVARAAFFSVAGTGQYLGGWTPWHSTTELPDGVAFQLPAGARIAVDVLYRGIGETVVDKPTLALYFASHPRPVPVGQLVLQPPAGQGASSPPHARRVGAELRVPVDSRLLSMRTDMAAGAKSLEIKTRRPDGVVQILLLIKEYPQQWQTPYVFRQPIAVPKDSLIQATAYFSGDAVAQSRPPFTVTFQTYQNPL
ncbi:MAG: hypothetical protein ACRD1Q_11155 [Vicinamibacterales bacterium]